MADPAGGGSSSSGLPIPSGWADCEVFDNGDGDSLHGDQALAKVATVRAGGTLQKKQRGGTVSGIHIEEDSDDMHEQHQLPLYDNGSSGGAPLATVHAGTSALTVTPSVRRQQEKDVMAHNSTAASLDTIGAAIRSSKNFASRTKLCELNLDSVLSSTSYRSIMRQTFGTDGSIDPSAFSAGQQQQQQQTGNVAARIPTITRAFEESYMREPHPHERECARGPKCECMFIDPSLPFVSVEFLTIEEIGNPPLESQLCVVCSRKETQYLYYDMVFNRKVYNGVIQRYGNVSGANEYATECLLRCTKSGDLSCMPKPIMSHQRNRYSVCRHPDLDILCLRQTRVSPHDHVSSAALENPAGCTPKSQCLALASSARTPPDAAGTPRAGKNRGF